MAEWFWQEKDVWRGEVQNRIREGERAKQVESADLFCEEWEEQKSAEHAEKSLEHENDSDARSWESKAAHEFER